MQRRVHIKLATTDAQFFQAQSFLAGITPPPAVVHQEDTYYATSGAGTRVRLRVERCGAAPPSITLLVAGDGGALDLFPRFGAESGAVAKLIGAALQAQVSVNKRRTTYLDRELRVSFDEVEGLGKFVELEAPVHGKSEATAREHATLVRQKMGLGDVREEPLGYRELMLARAPDGVVKR